MTIDEAIRHCREVAEGCPGGDRQCAYQHDQLADWLAELQIYRQLRENGLLVQLPCKVGNTVYRYSRTEQRIQVLKCEGFLYNGVCWKARCTDVIPSWVGNQKRHFYIMFSSFGKTVFLAREEVEAALAKESAT